MSDVFKFKHFDICQDKCAMKVNTDAIILGAWSDLDGKKHVLDIGTGTGIIAIMLAQRNASITALGIEVDEMAFQQATANMVNAPYHDRLRCTHQSIQDYARDSSLKFDLIVSNPPFFSGGTFSLNENKAQVRHTIKLSHSDLLYSVQSLIDVEGHFDLILPYIEGLRFIEMASKYDFYPVKVTQVKPLIDKKIERLLIRLGAKYKGDCTNDELIIYRTLTANDYTDQMADLTRNFYLFL